MKKRMFSLALLLIMLVNLLGVSASAATTEYHINFNEEKKLFLVTSKSVTKTEWSTNNPAVVDIVDEGLLSCTVVGVDNQRGQFALITCHYWYMLAGTIFQDYEYFKVYVPEDGGGNSGGNSGGVGTSAKLRIEPASIKLDLAKKETAKVKVSISGFVNYPWDIICNGSSIALWDEVRRDTLAEVYEFETYRDKVGTRTVEFLLVDTSYNSGGSVGLWKDEITMELEVYCSHKWKLDEPSVEMTCTQDGMITQKTCTVCKATEAVEEIIPAPGAHTFGEWETYLEPTTQAVGIARRTCGCGEYEEKSIAKLPSDSEPAPSEPAPVAPATGFTDVVSGAWYHAPVQWAVENGITTGTSDTTFTPDASCTRAQAVTFLYRAAGAPAYKTKINPFTDVQEGAYYYDAVMWAMENGITNGTSNTTFSPDGECTRGQIVTFLWRAEDTPAGEGENPFGDVNADAYYADAVLWAVEGGITNGMTETTFAPDAYCTRAQIVTFLHRANK